MKPELVILGAGGHAMVVADIIRIQDEYNIVGFLDDVSKERRGTEFCGAPILGGVECLETVYQSGVRHMIVAIGDCSARMNLSDLVVAKGFSLVAAIHPTASIASDVLIRSGTVVKAMAVIEPGAVVKENVIVGAGTYIGHECVIEKCACISAGGKVGGKSVIGQSAWIGLGAIVCDRVCVGDRAQVAAGSVAVKDIPNDIVAFGVPAKPRWARDLFEGKLERQRES